MMFGEQIRPGNRGGAGDFKWSDVSGDKDRENYLGHSINAPTGRWQKNKDVHWYSRDKDVPEDERAAEIRKIKEAEADALAVALGFAPSVKAGTESGEGSGPTATSPTSPAEDAEKEERRKRKAERRERKEEKRARKEQRRFERDSRRSRSRSPVRRDRDSEDRRHRDRRDRSASPPHRRRSPSPGRGGYDAEDRERERELQRRRWDANARREQPSRR